MSSLNQHFPDARPSQQNYEAVRFLATSQFRPNLIASRLKALDILQHLTHNVEPIMLLTLVRVYIGSTNMVGIAILEYKLQSLSSHISASDLVTCLAGCCGTCQTLHNVNILKVSPGLILITQLQPIYDRKYKYANIQVNKKISGIELVWLGASH